MKLTYKDIKDDIDSIASELCKVVDGDFDIYIMPDFSDDSINKIAMMINFLLNTVNDEISIKEREKIALNNSIQAEKNNAVSSLVMGMAHDFNNVINIAMGYVALLHKEALDCESITAKLNHLDLALSHMSELMKSLVDFSSNDAVEKTPTSLRCLIENNQDLLIKSAGQNQLIFDIEDNSEIKGNESILISLLMNLIKNASQAMKSKGKIKLSLTTQVIKQTLNLNATELPPGSYQLISVEDSGTGIDKEDLNKLFLPFYSTKKFGVAEKKGYGLGLSSVNSIIKKLDGYINIESTKGVGSTFSVYFPILTHKKNDASYIDSNISDENIGTILLVDDEKDIRDIYSELLAGYGYSVEVADCGKTALDSYIKNKDNIDIIISDVAMPIMGGIELLKEVKKISSEIKVLLCTGNIQDERLTNEKLINDPAVVLMQKPIKIDVLLSSIESLLNSSNSGD